MYYLLLGFDIRQFSASTAVPAHNRDNLRDIVVEILPIFERQSSAGWSACLRY